MNIDVSPDGLEIVFDFLGDIYVMPITGGQATPIKTGVSWDIQPRYSPSGQWILFTSDTSGCENVWIISRANSSQLYQISTEGFHYVTNAWWLDDSTIIAVKWYVILERSIPAGELWTYPIDSVNSTDFQNPGRQLVGRTPVLAQIGPEEPVVSAECACP